MRGSEMNMIEIKTASLRAACECMTTKDIRYYLCGVQIVRKGDMMHVRGTDGHIAFDDATLANEEAGEQVEFIIPAVTAKLLAKVKKPKLQFHLRDDGKWECEDVLFTPLDGKFPDVDRVIPARKSFEPMLEPVYYDAELLYRCQKAMRIATGQPNAFFRLQYANVALMHRETDLFPVCVVMALNSNRAFLDN
jgi:hypothetical protein